MIIYGNIILKSQIYGQLVTMLLFYHFLIMKGLFELLPMQALWYK